MTGESPRDPDGANSLQTATSIAVAENQSLARQTADELLALAVSLRTTRSGAARAGDIDEAVTAVLTAERNLLVTITDQLEELAHQQLDGMDAFNIVLFGRTGAGKSSLLEALSASDGGSVRSASAYVKTHEESVFLVTQHRAPSACRAGRLAMNVPEPRCSHSRVLTGTVPPVVVR